MGFNESSLEFDLFESMRLRLARLLTVGGREEIEAERIALYVMQGVREVPRLLNALASGNTSQDETRDILKLVLDNADSLERARALLAGQDVPEDVN
ncbi:MAG TPA: hypothetical protein VEX60_08320 [Pyrinomonadaceae bacterium]|nr:hypothetical protein [Pyrinomonadaceae bacterium]